MPAEGLYQKHRPKMWKEIVGQPDALLTLKGYKPTAVPHAVLFTGHPGCGKTTCARILANKVGAHRVDIKEYNCAKERGIDVARQIDVEMRVYGMGGRLPDGRPAPRVYILDEFHQMTGEAQTAFLKMLEDPPRHVYFFLCTTHVHKVLKTILSRCTQIVLGAMKPDHISELVQKIANKEKFELHPTVRTAIIQAADGSGRQALVLLEKAMGCQKRVDQLAVIQAADVNAQAIDIFRMLIKRDPWGNVRDLLKQCEADAEGVRRVILACCTTALLADKPNVRALAIFDEFRDSFYESGKAALVVACWNVINPPK